MGKTGADLLSETKKVASLRHIGIRKTKLISTPRSAIESTVVMSEQVASSQDSETQEVRLNASVDK
jgi:ribosomal protein S3AE